MTIPEQYSQGPAAGGWPPQNEWQQYHQPQYGQTQYGQPEHGQPDYGQPQYYGPADFYQPPYQQPPRRRGGRRAAAVLGGGLAVLVLGGAIGFAAGWSAHSSSTASSTSPYLPLAPGNGSQNGGGNGTGTDPNGSGSGSGSGNGSGSGSTGATGATAAQVSAVAAKVDPALVDIDTVLGAENGEAAGTGIVIGSSGVILTNNHVVAGATSITVTDLGNSKQYRAAVVGYDRTGDVAVLQLSGASGLTTATLAGGTTVKAGDPVVAIGNAGGAGGTPSAVGGAVSAINQSITASDESSGSSEQLTGLIEVNADIEAGDSGGPLLTTAGQVIGMDTAASAGFQYQASGGDGYAIPIGTATTIADQIRSGQSSSTIHLGATAYLGIETSSSSRGYQSVAGPVIVGVVAGTPADSAGLTRGDVITSLAGTKVDSATTLTNLIDGYHPGDHVKLAWTDLSGQSHSSTVKLATGPVG